MKDYKKHKIKFNPFLEKLYQSDKAMIIYKVKDGYNIYTDFSKKIILNNKNVEKFLNKFNRKKRSKETDLFIGFFGYEILCYAFCNRSIARSLIGKCIKPAKIDNAIAKYHA